MTLDPARFHEQFRAAVEADVPVYRLVLRCPVHDQPMQQVAEDRMACPYPGCTNQVAIATEEEEAT